MHLPTCAVCVAVTPYLRCEHCRPGARPMNTATVSLHMLVVGGPNVADALVPCGPSLGKMFGRDHTTVEAPTSFVDLCQGAPARSTKLSISIECTTTFVPRCFKHFRAWFDVVTCLCNLGDAGMLGCCARLHVWATCIPCCL